MAVSNFFLFFLFSNTCLNNKTTAQRWDYWCFYTLLSEGEPEYICIKQDLLSISLTVKILRDVISQERFGRWCLIYAWLNGVTTTHFLSESPPPSFSSIQVLCAHRGSRGITMVKRMGIGKDFDGERHVYKVSTIVTCEAPNLEAGVKDSYQKS